MTISTYNYIANSAIINEIRIDGEGATVNYTLESGETRELSTKDAQRISKLMKECADVTNGNSGVVVEAISKKNGKRFLFAVNHFAF